MKTTVKWTGAIVLSLLAHAGIAKLLEPGEAPTELAMIQGGEAMEVAVLGNAFEEVLQAGDPAEEVEPLEAEPEEVEPEPVETAEIVPVQPDIVSETPSDIVPTEADIILPAEDIVPVQSEQAEITATIAPVETVVPEEKPEPDIIKPEPEKKPEAKKKPEKKKPRKKDVKKRAGDAGKSVVAQRKGQADGIEGAAANSSTGKKGNASRQAGNANMSNYDGKVRARLNRSFRFPAAAKRDGARGVVQVQFTVSSGGEAGSIRIVRSSGHPALDQAALEAVRRASPFPNIPESAGISSKAYTIPLQFGIR
ncbi:energy transducer TonB [Pararhizobium gei]|uniref:energy transducer TonB n=1 Tax=Pararhizobium gei TaxID=1395951 RepID=UPI0023DA92D9|nr:energy transducer TonB [Rhizobium gei]